MTHAGIVEYVEAVRVRYFGGTKKEKGKILDEFTILPQFNPPKLNVSPDCYSTRSHQAQFQGGY